MANLRLVVSCTIAIAAAAGPSVATVHLGAPAAFAPSPSATAQASAGADVPGLQVAVRSDDVRTPSVVLTNGASAACRVATTSLGTVTIGPVDQDGTAIEPIFFDAAFADSIELAIIGRLQVLQPGTSVELPLHVLPVGPTGSAIETVQLSAAGPIGALYPVHTDRPLRLTATYAVPVTSPGVGLCVAGGAAGPPASSRPGWLWWVVIGAGVLIGLGILVLVVRLIRRRSQRRQVGPGAATVLVLAAIVLTLLGRAAPARADIDVSPPLSGAWASCSTIFHGPGGDPAEILPTLEAGGTTVQIIPAGGDITHEGATSPSQIFIFWDIDDHHKYFGSGGEADPCTSLYHEMYHAWEDATGGQDHSPCVGPNGPSGLPVNEVTATRAQNKLRKLLGLGERDHYGRTPLPDYCLPPSQQPHAKEACSAGGTCGDSNGDPHLFTFDRLRYDFQAVGEFVATRDPAGGFEIQVRQSPWSTSRLVAVNTAVAMDVAGNRVQVQAARGAPVLLVDGHGVPLESRSLSKGGSIDVTPEAYGAAVTVEWPDGSAAMTRPIGPWGLHLSVAPSAKHAGVLQGLLGNDDRDPTNDVVLAGGAAVAKPTFADLYPAYANRWRVTSASSLFAYAPGTSTATFTDTTFPDRPTALDQVPGRASIEALCRRLGVTDAVLLAACVLDVGLTGQPDFGIALANTQAGTFGALNGTETELRVAHPGDKPHLTFSGTAGQVVFVDVPATTLPSECSPLKLRDPTGHVVNSGCVINGDGYIDRTVLATTGQYTVSAEPAKATGAVWVSVVTAADQVKPIAPGAAVDIMLDRPGSQGILTFDGTAGQSVLASVASSLPSECSPLSIRDPSGKNLSSGCVINGSGYVDRTTLPVTGHYSIVVDPNDRTFGDARVRLYVAADQTGSVTVNGAEVEARLTTPGSQARFTFVGTAGQRVSIEATSSSLPSQCSPLLLLNPAGTQLASGCVINGTGSIAALNLPAAGTYIVVVDPVTDSSGVTKLRVRSP